MYPYEFIHIGSKPLFSEIYYLEYRFICDNMCIRQMHVDATNRWDSTHTLRFLRSNVSLSSVLKNSISCQRPCELSDFARRFRKCEASANSFTQRKWIAQSKVVRKVGRRDASKFACFSSRIQFYFVLFVLWVLFVVRSFNFVGKCGNRATRMADCVGRVMRNLKVFKIIGRVFMVVWIRLSGETIMKVRQFSCTIRFSVPWTSCNINPFYTRIIIYKVYERSEKKMFFLKTSLLTSIF